MTAIGIKEVYKSYGEVQALSDISVEIGRGELFGFIGPDGAGKSTLFRLIVTLLVPDQGSISFLGFDTLKDFREIRKICGYMPGQFSLYLDLSVEENLRFFATAFGTSIKENYHLIGDIYSQLEPYRKRLARNLSGGMKQKLALCCSLIHKPEVLILDEPTTGVDAISRKEFWDMLHRLQQSGLTIVVSTPYMDEASRCDRVALMQSGRLLDINTPEGLKASYPGKLLKIMAAELFTLLADIRSFGRGVRAHAYGDSIHVEYSGNPDLKDDLQRFLFQRGHAGLSVQEQMPGIEDCFISYMEGRADE